MKSIPGNVLTLCTVILLAAATAAHAQPANDAERCASITNNPDLAIQHCSRAIESGKFTGEPLARLHYNRGIEWAAKSNYDRAIADYDAAIQLNPRNGDAYYNRGNAWGNKGDHDRAIADYDIAVKLDPKSSGTLLARGRTRLYSGDFPRAVADLEQSLKLDYNEYTALWLYLARKRGGAADAEERLDNETRASRGGSWPVPIIVLYLGRTDPDSVFAASTDPDARKQREQRCEATFYVAHWHLIRNDRERALPLLKEAQGSCPREFLEHEGAVAELRRLTK